MKRILILGTALALGALMMFSCNKKRFDFDDSLPIEGSGQWKLPIGSVKTTIGKVLDQLSENNVIMSDANGNLRFQKSFEMNDVIKGSTFMSLGNLHAPALDLTLENPYPGIPITPIDAEFQFYQRINLANIMSDTLRIERFELRSGKMKIKVKTDLGHVSQIELISPDITFPDGSTLHDTYPWSGEDVPHELDLAGATFSMTDPETGLTHTTISLQYIIHYQLDGVDLETYKISTQFDLEQLKVKEISGYIDHLVQNFNFDEDFELPMNVQGQLTLLGTKIGIMGKNSFGNLTPALYVDEAVFRGNHADPLPLLDPVTLVLPPSQDFVPAMDEKTLNLTFNTDNTQFHMAGQFDLNPNGTNQLLTIKDESSIGLRADVTIPFSFNIPNVTYTDTVDIDFSGISATQMVNEIILGLLFKSQMPFNFGVDLYTYNSQLGMITDTLLVNGLDVKGSFDGSVVRSEGSIDVTQSRLNSLLNADKLVMRLGLDTENKDVTLNRENGLEMIIKADVLYGGTMDVNN